MGTKVGSDGWIEAGWMALIERGVSGVKVEALARKLGVTKGSFYHHFKNRAELLDEMLERWVRMGTELAIEVADQRQRPDERFISLIETIFTPTPFDGVEVAIRSWAATDEAVARVVSQVDERRLSYVRGLLEERGFSTQRSRARAEILYRVVIGDFMWRSIGGRELDAIERAELSSLILASLD